MAAFDPKLPFAKGSSRPKAVVGDGQLPVNYIGREHACQRRLESHPWAYCKIDLGAVAERENLDWLNKAIEYSRRHGIQLIMEKIESQRDLDVLSPVKNSAWYQGYCFSRPELVRGAQDTLRKVSGAEG